MNISFDSHAVAVNPSNDFFITTIGANAQYSCSASTPIESLQWLLNGTLVEELELDKVTVTEEGHLEFHNISVEYNYTSITCNATLTSGSVVTSEEKLLLIQGVFSAQIFSYFLQPHPLYTGYLPAVGSLNRTRSSSALITLTWTPPFTLNITNFSPDISGYCVDVVDHTSSSTLHSECNITKTQFSYPITDCHVYNFTVTPVNRVGNGTRHYTYTGTVSILFDMCDCMLYSHAVPCTDGTVTTMVLLF